MDGLRVMEPGPRGGPHQLVCTAHPGCTWRRDLAGAPKPTDPIVIALFNAHLRDRKTSVPSMMGHPKRPRS